MLSSVCSPELLLDYAHDLVHSESTWAGCADIAYAYCKAHKEHYKWSRISDVYLCLWDSGLLLLLCDLARCDREMHAQILFVLDKALLGEALLLQLIPSCLEKLSKVTEVEQAKGEDYHRYASAFFVLHKLLILLSVPHRTTVISKFLKERLVFHFYFDCIVPANSPGNAVMEFRKFLDNDFPSASQFSTFVFNLIKQSSNQHHDILALFHKYLVYP